MATSLAFCMLGASLLISAALCAWPPPSEAHNPRRNAASITLFLVFILLGVGILGAGSLYSTRIQQKFRGQMEGELSAIADLKVRELQQWRRDHLEDGIIFFQNVNFSELIRAVLNNPEDGNTRRRLETWLKKIEKFKRYERISLTDATGNTHLSLAGDSATALADTQAHAHDTFDPQQVSLVDFHRAGPDGPPRLAIIVPILAAPEWKHLLAILTFEIDPHTDLYPLMRNWPTTSKTAETQLVRREGDAVLFLNNLRFRQDAALQLRLPLSRIDLPPAMAIKGQRGIVEGIDYQGKEVIAALRSVPDSPWLLVARINQDEIYQPLRQQLLVIFGFLTTLLVAVGILVWFIWHSQTTHFYRLHYEAALALEESEKRLRILFESSRDGILVAEIRTKKFLIANNAICRLLGYEQSELLTMGMNDIHPENELAAVGKKFMQLALGEETLAVDIPMLCRDGSVVYADINGARVDLGGVACILGSFRDTTERRQSEAKIGHLNRVLRAIRNVNQLIVKTTSVDELIASACSLLVEGKSYTSAIILLTDDKQLPIAHAEAGTNIDFRHFIEEISQGKLPACCHPAATRAGIQILRTRDSFCATCQLDSMCIPPQRMVTRLDHQQKIYGFLIVSVAREIILDREEEELFSEVAGDLAYCLHNMRMNREMIRSEEEKKILEEQFFQAQKMEAVGRLAGGIAHDFNNMLSIIIGYATILEEEVMPTASSQEALSEIHDAAVRAKNLTRQLLAFSRKQILEMHIIDVNEVIDSFQKLLRRTLGEDIELRLTLSPEALTVKADASQLEQILLNLAVNARDAMPDGGILTLETALVTLDEEYLAAHPGTSPGLHVMMAISDNGSGMDKEIQARIFEPFFTTKDLGKGTGLGLSTVYGVVQQHGGTIWISSEPGHGTTFKIYLPAVNDQVGAEENREGDQMPANHGETILVVEDEPSVRKLACQILRRSGFTVLESTDVGNAVDLAREHSQPIDLLLTDVVMPTLKGTEVFQRVSVFQPGIKVLYMSGYTDNVIAHHGVLDDGVQFLQKPFTAEGLLAKVDETFNR